MQFQKEQGHHHSIIAYDTHQLKIGDTIYTQNLLVDKNQIHCPWSATSLLDINPSDLMAYDPKVVIVGINKALTLPTALMIALSKQGVGIEVMSIGAACRTYNVLLSEDRDVLGAFLF